MRVPPTIRWLGLALLGILIAAAVSVAASRLASQQIGLASEPLTAGDALAPPARSEQTHRRPASSAPERRRDEASPGGTSPPAIPSTEPPAEPVPPAPEIPANPPGHGDEAGRSGEGGDGGGGGDD